MPLILSIDPSGDERGTTGIVLLLHDSDNSVELVESWGIPGGIDAFSDWCDQYNIRSPQTVIVEHFVNRNRPGADISPLGMEYIVRWLRSDTILSPAAGKNTAVPDEVLKRLDLFDFPGDHHHDRREAARHAVRWLKSQGHIPTLEKGWPRA